MTSPNTFVECLQMFAVNDSNGTMEAQHVPFSLCRVRQCIHSSRFQWPFVPWQAPAKFVLEIGNASALL